MVHISRSIHMAAPVRLELTTHGLGHLFHLLHLAHTNTVPPIANLKQEKVSNLTAPIIVKVVRYIQENFHEKFSLQELSMEYQLSQPWLCKCFLNAMGMTIFEYKTMLQVQNVKKLLNATSLSLNAIADKSGFSSSRYFCMVFKKHTGTSPLQWRKHFRPTDNTILNKKRK